MYINILRKKRRGPVTQKYCNGFLTCKTVIKVFKDVVSDCSCSSRFSRSAMYRTFFSFDRAADCLFAIILEKAEIVLS
jgi:hypothetical protein